MRAGRTGFDIAPPDGTSVEIDSTSHIQSWQQTVLSEIRYGIAPMRVQDQVLGRHSGETKRQADLYRFAFIALSRGWNADPKILDEGEFYAPSTIELVGHMGARKENSLSGL